MSHSQSLKPLQNQQKSVLTQTEMSHSQSLKPLQNQQKSVLTQIELLELDSHRHPCRRIPDRIIT